MSYWLIFQRDQLLIIKENDACQVPTLASISHLKPHLFREHLLSQINHDIYCAELMPEMQIAENTHFVPLRKALELLGDEWYNIAARAFAIINWDRNFQFCGHCGKATLYRANTFERYCADCELTFYPRISPSIIVLIHKGDEILMARGPHFAPGAYGLIAGFVEAGESVENAVHREVKEEVGIEIDHLTYFGSQAWPFPDSLMIGFIAQYKSGELVINHTEIEHADWYHYDKLPGRPSTSISIASKLLNFYLTQKKKN